ncbi:hypothetical protein BU17DRAFT_60996 [Hysterangium stoloniferum]|nr:hypothetical protein BU17DRAFT_60996 [Hysterangium stoloniferum]
MDQTSPPRSDDFDPKSSNAMDPNILDKEHHPLQEYFKNLVLQPLVFRPGTPKIINGRSEHLCKFLNMKPGGTRALKHIKPFPNLNEEMSTYFNESPATKGVETEMEKLNLSINMTPKQLIDKLSYNPFEVEKRTDVIYDIVRGPIRSAQKIANAFLTALKNFSFITPPRGSTLSEQGLEPMYFCKRDKHGGGLKNIRCIAIPTAPWEFTSVDFDEFVNKEWFVEGSTSGKDTTSGEGTTSGKGKDLDPLSTIYVWATNVIILSLHRYTTAFVSPVISCYEGRTTMEYLTYWLLSSVDAPDLKKLPQDCFKANSTNLKRMFGSKVAPDNLKRPINAVDNSSEPLSDRPRRDPLELCLGSAQLEGHEVHRDPFSPKRSRRVNRQRLKQRHPPKEDHRCLVGHAQPNTNDVVPTDAGIIIDPIDGKGKHNEIHSNEENAASHDQLQDISHTQPVSQYQPFADPPYINESFEDDPMVETLSSPDPTEGPTIDYPRDHQLLALKWFTNNHPDSDVTKQFLRRYPLSLFTREVTPKWGNEEAGLVDTPDEPMAGFPRIESTLGEPPSGSFVPESPPNNPEKISEGTNLTFVQK